MEDQTKRSNRILNKKANKLREDLLSTFGIQVEQLSENRCYRPNTSIKHIPHFL